MHVNAYAAWSTVGSLYAGAVFAGWCWRGRWEHRRRRGGYMRPLASARTKDGGQRTPATGITVRISSYSALGDPWADTAYRVRLRRMSRRGARGWSGNATAARGANGAQPLSADYGNHLRYDVNTASTPITFKPW